MTFRLEVMIPAHAVEQTKELFDEYNYEGLTFNNCWFRDFMLSVRKNEKGEPIRMFDSLNDIQKMRMLGGYNDLGVVNIRNFCENLDEGSLDIEDDNEREIARFFRLIQDIWNAFAIDLFNILID